MDVDSNAALGAAIQHAAGNLPEHAEIVINVENGGYDVALIRMSPEDNFYPDNDNITDDILECVSESITNIKEI